VKFLQSEALKSTYYWYISPTQPNKVYNAQCRARILHVGPLRDWIAAHLVSSVVASMAVGQPDRLRHCAAWRQHLFV